MKAPDTARCPHCFGAATATPCPHCGWQLGQDNPPPALALGRVLDGRYRVGRVLGHGGFGITYLAWDDNLYLRLAIKEEDGQEGLVSPRQILASFRSAATLPILAVIVPLPNPGRHPQPADCSPHLPLSLPVVRCYCP